MRTRLFCEPDEWPEEPIQYVMPEVDVWEDDPVGVILGPTGDVVSVVMPHRHPLGFQRRGQT